MGCFAEMFKQRAECWFTAVARGGLEGRPATRQIKVPVSRPRRSLICKAKAGKPEQPQTPRQDCGKERNMRNSKKIAEEVVKAAWRRLACCMAVDSRNGQVTQVAPSVHDSITCTAGGCLKHGHGSVDPKHDPGYLFGNSLLKLLAWQCQCSNGPSWPN